MPVHTSDALFRALRKGELARVYYFGGPENLLKDEAIRSILDLALDRGIRDFNLDQRSAAQLDGEELSSLCNTLPMLADRRVVVIRELEAWRRKIRARSEFLRYLENPSDQTIVILVQGGDEDLEDRELIRSAYAVRFDPLSPERAAKWVLHQAGRIGLALEEVAAEHLVRSVGTDLGALNVELSKLASLADARPVTVDTVGELVGIRVGETQWDWRRAVLEGEPHRAISLLPAILAQPGMSGVKLVTLIGTTLIGLGVTRRMYDKGLRGRSLEDSVYKALLRSRPGGLLPYKEESAAWGRIIPQWPATRIRNALRAALASDQALKSTTISDERGVLTDLVLRLTVRKARAA